MMEFLFGYAIGNMSGGASTVSTPSTSTTAEKIAPPNGGDVYINGPALERISNPMDIRIGSCGWESFWDYDDRKPKNGSTYQRLFDAIPHGDGDFVILRITRILSGQNTSAAFWFEYIEASKLR